MSVHLMQPASVPLRPILDRAYGKAPTFSTSDTTQFKRAIDMTDDELAAIAARSQAYHSKIRYLACYCLNTCTYWG